MIEEERTGHDTKRGPDGDTAPETFVVPEELEAFFDRVEAERGERAAAEAALAEAERRAAAQADRSMHLTDTAKDTVNGALSRIGANLDAGRDAGDALDQVKKEIARLQTEEKATLAALRNELGEIGNAELTAADDAAESMSRVFGALEERATERQRVREFTDGFAADVNRLTAWKEAWAANLASLANEQESLRTMPKDKAAEFLGARAQQAEAAEAEIRSIQAAFEERFRVARDDLDYEDGRIVTPYESETLDRLAAIASAVVKKHDALQKAIAMLA